MARTRTILVALVTGAAAGTTLVSADTGDLGELSGGVITGPFIKAAYLAALILFGSCLLATVHDRASKITNMTGWLLAMPWASWLLFPGEWCADGNCVINYPRFVPEPIALAIIALPPIALALRRWPR